jgi:isocitrate dehydrogenase kinase/phosphatase
MSLDSAFRRLPVRQRIDSDLIAEALRIPGFSVAFRDARGDAERIAERVNDLISGDAFGGILPVALDVVEAGFFRDLSAFLVGRWVMPDGGFVPFVLALLNSKTVSMPMQCCTVARICTTYSVQRSPTST